ncbi:MAG: hypothetical protein A2583_13595 [Bdellovibrionales bacterium RIFOXYD1_FULL_53_11]|nr:MAG: hypothetical protein A2583_13595 [Bdellovibrionales bacterium RIFOXYD1_FULL_53_11]
MRLTERDFDLLRYLAEQGVASARQLAQKFFPSVASFRTRIGFLNRADLVESVPITALKELSHSSYFETATDVLGASRQNVCKYRVYRLGQRFGKKWPHTGRLSDIKMWRHQLMVNELRAVFEKKFPRALFLNDPQAIEEWRLFQRSGPADSSDLAIPDLTVRVDDLNIAIEIERTQKAEREYFGRFFKFRDSDYTHVIYYCATERIFKMVSKLARCYEWMAVARFGTIHEVYRLWPGWIKLDEFLSERHAHDKRL